MLWPSKSSALDLSRCSNELCLSFQQNPEGVFLSQLVQRSTNQNLLANQLHTLFQITGVIDNQHLVECDSNTGWSHIEIVQNDVELTWKFREHRNEIFTGVAIDVSVRLHNQRSAWYMTISGSNTKLKLLNVRFPKNFKFDLGPDAPFHIHFPRGPGFVKGGPFAQPLNLWGQYPSHGVTYQMMGMYTDDVNVYVAVEDPTGSHKSLGLFSESGQIVPKVEFHPPEEPQNNWEWSTPGPVIIDIGRGDWYDAAQKYRSFAQTTPWWKPEGLKPSKMRDTAFWINCGKIKPCIEGSQRTKKLLDVPVGVHWYEWHAITMDGDFPHYFPERDGFKAAVEQLKKNDITVMPYINVQLWNRHLSDFIDEGLPDAVKRRDQSPVGDDKFVFMCPIQKRWQERMVSTVSRLVNEFAVDGVYLDLMGLYAPQQCYDPTHQHAPGGGDFWVRGHQHMTTKMRQTNKDLGFLSMEGNAEAYSRNVDGVLTWQWTEADQERIYATIYHDQLAMFGRAYYPTDDDFLSFRMIAAQSLVFGEQIGWVPESLMQPGSQAMTYFEKVAKAHQQLKPFIYEGTSLRPPIITNDIPMATGRWVDGEHGLRTLPSVQVGAWKRDDTSVAVFANVLPNDVTVFFKMSKNGPIETVTVPSHDVLIHFARQPL